MVYLRRFIASFMLIMLAAGIVTMLSAVPAQTQNIYIPQPGAIRTFQGDAINIALTGCGGTTSGVSINYRFLAPGAIRPTDITVNVSPPTGACPGGQGFQDAQIPLGDGWLYAVNINNNSAQDQSQMWIQTFLGRGAVTFNNNAGAVNNSPLNLVSCSPGQFQQCSWVLGTTQGGEQQDTSMLSRNMGANINQSVGNPAAGLNFSTVLTNNTNLLYNVQNIRFTLVTGVAVANRYACVQFQAPAAGPIWLTSCSPIAQIAASTVSYNFSIGTGPTPVITIVAGTGNPDVTAALPSLVQISDASTVASNIVGIQAADQISNVVIRSQFANYRD